MVWDIDSLLEQWWVWSRVQTDRPCIRMSMTCEFEYAPLQITDEQGMAVDAAMATLKQRDPEDYAALITYLANGLSVQAVADMCGISGMDALNKLWSAEKKIKAILFAGDAANSTLASNRQKDYTKKATTATGVDLWVAK